MESDSLDNEFKAVLNKFGKKSQELSEEMPGGEIDGVSIHEKAYILRYLDFISSGMSSLKARREAFSNVWFGRRFEDLELQDQSTCRIESWKMWSQIEKRMGGVNGLASFMGFDQVRLISETERLLRLKRVVTIDKTGKPIESDDGATQVKALEMLYKMFGHLENNQIDQSGVNININFSRNKSKLYEEGSVILSGIDKEEVIEGE